MTIEEFIWDSQNQSVSWKYNGEFIKKTCKNVHFATVNTQKNFVYVEAGKDYSQEQVYHFSFDGKQMFAFDKESSKVNWLYNDQLVEIECKNIMNAQLYSGQGVVIVITEPDQVDRRLQGFTLDGALSFEKEPPQGYSFVYLSMSKNQPSVVCDGEKNIADVYGRNRWHFAINTQTGDMTKENLAY